MTTNTGGNDDFEAFVSSGEVEVGDSNAAPSANEEKPRKRATPPVPAKKAETAAASASDDGDDDEKNKQGGGADDGDEGDDGAGNADDQGGADDGDEGDDVPNENREGYIKRLKRERAEARRKAREAEARLSALEGSGIAERLARLENWGLPAGNAGGKSETDIGKAPDPTDTAKYPLGHLDDQYVEDKLDWLATKKAAEKADAALQRQQEAERTQAQQREQQVLLQKVDTLAAKGNELFDDFQESVVESGMKGEWKLTQTTFEAAAEADHGAQILYELAQNPKEADRVASLPLIQQLRFVDKRNAEIAEKAKSKKIPGAGAPPSTQTRGASSKVRINPATENLDDFEKAWEADAKGR